MSSQLFTQSASDSSHSHKRNASSYNSAENGGPSSSISSTAVASSSNSAVASGSGVGAGPGVGGGIGYGLMQRSPSPSPTKATFDDDIHNGPLGGSNSLARSGSDHALSSSGPLGLAGLTPQRIGKAIATRFMRAAKRGNLPFLFVFFSCTLVFFSALAGIGYHEPPSDSLVDLSGESAEPAGGFKFGGPVFDLTDAQAKERRIAEQRALEESWAKKRRPKDGAWMRKQRDDKAIRRKPQAHTASPISTAHESYQTVVAEMSDTGDDASEGLEKRDAAPPS